MVPFFGTNKGVDEVNLVKAPSWNESSTNSLSPLLINELQQKSLLQCLSFSRAGCLISCTYISDLDAKKCESTNANVITAAPVTMQIPCAKGHTCVHLCNWLYLLNCNFSCVQQPSKIMQGVARRSALSVKCLVSFCNQLGEILQSMNTRR